MEQRLSRWGVGPRIFVPAFAYSIVAAVATYTWPEFCVLTFLPRGICTAAGVVLLAIGIPMWLTSIFGVMRAYKRDALITSGLYALVRHPVYSAWIVFNLPAIALLARSWPLMLSPAIGYLLFKSRIRTEDDYLRQRFGQDWLDYRARVNELIPLPRFRR